MAITIAFDVYGTLIDTQGIVTELSRRIGDSAPAFSRLWRDKQLEYTFRRGLMRRYEDFSVCTADALRYTNLSFGAPLADADFDALMAAYSVLPAFGDLADGLAAAKKAGHRLFALSNGRADAVTALLTHARIIESFEGIVSVDEIGSYKPDPDVYRHFLRRSGAEAADAWLVSSNPFDVVGAMSAGLRAAWIKRSPDALFDPWRIEPTLIASDLIELVHKIEDHRT